MMMTVQSAPTTSDLRVRKIIAQTYLNENRIQQALDLFAGILRDYPDDQEALMVMGNLYLAGGDCETAGVLYRQALEYRPGNVSIQRQLALAEAEASGGRPEALPTDPQAILRLLQRLTGSPQVVEEDELWEAARLLETIVHSERPSEQVELHLDKITALLPALIEINERQARADGRPTLADGLHELKKNIYLQMELSQQSADAPEPAESERPALIRQEPRFNGRVMLIGAEDESGSKRMAHAKLGLEAIGIQVLAGSKYSAADDPRPDVMVIGNPHANPKLLESMAAAAAGGIPIVVDFSDHFELMPVNHRDYPVLGLGTLAQARAYNTSLLLAHHITVSSEVHAASLNDNGFPAAVVPDSWQDSNPFWTNNPTARHHINLGWCASVGDVNDLLLIKRVIVRILREFADTQIMVSGDPQAYRLFDTIAENRRIFMPAAAAEEYPYQLSQLDVLLVPLRNDPYHYALSDRVVMEAGARGIPWISSPVQAVVNWQAGGLVANSQDEWYLYLRELVSNASVRAEFAKAGMTAAQNRRAGQIGEYWMKAITQAVQQQNSKTA